MGGSHRFYPGPKKISKGLIRQNYCIELVCQGGHMEEVLEFLQLKNHYYEKFYSITVRFLAKAESERWEDLDYTVDSRERILNIIRHYDMKIARAFDKVAASDDDLNRYSHKVKSLLSNRDSLVKRIVDLDLKLISIMDEMKSDTIRELKKTQEASQQIHSFVSTNGAKKPKTNLTEN